MGNTVSDTPTSVIICPICQKSKIFSFGAKGRMSSHCAICGRTIMWDFDKLQAHPISNYPSLKLKHAN